MLQIAILCLALVIPISFPLHAQEFKFDHGRKKQAISFTKVKNLIIIPVYINGKGPYNFLLDTGVSQMIITDTAFLKTLDISKSQTIKIQGYGLGKEIEALLTRNITARVGKASIQNIPTAIFKDDIFDLSSYLGIKISGILGYYFFNSFIVKINYESDKITFYDPKHQVKRKGIKIPIQMIKAKPYLTAEVNTIALGKTSVDLLVDNGSSHPLLLESYDNGPFPLPSTIIPANLGVGINGQINGSMGRILSLRLQNFTFNNILSGFPEYNINRTDLEGTPRNGSLGAEVLKHFLVTFDYRNEAIYLKKTNNFSKKFDHDMSGIEIYIKQNPNDRYFISRVESGSPADEVGLVEDDEILSVNFRNMQYYDLNELTEMFRDEDGKQLILEIKRKNKVFMVILILKRRI